MSKFIKDKKVGLLSALKDLARHVFLHNGGFKLLALVISLILWAGLISQDPKLTRDKTFTNISVNQTGAEAMKRNGFVIVSDLTEALSGVTAVASVPQLNYEEANVSAYNPRVDLSRVNGTGEQTLEIRYSSSTTYGKITSVQPASVPVEVEEYISRYQIPTINPQPKGDIPAGWWASSIDVEPKRITVSGPRSLVSSVARGRVYPDYSEVEWKEGTWVSTSPIYLLNYAGEVVDSPLLEITYNDQPLDSVTYEMMILPTRSFEISSLIKLVNEGNTAEGFEVKSMKISPESITVAAREEVLASIGEATLLTERSVDVHGLKETTSFTIRVIPPSEDAYLSNDTITVIVEIGPVGETESGTAGNS